MLTPQEIQEKQFVKAVFGGYDMSNVDAFLEQVETDYAALYKENAILKSKIKVLVEKVEEYRATEDSMRMALLTAQKMGDELVSEAAKQKSTILASAQEEVSARREQLEQQAGVESDRLEAAKAANGRYAAQVRTLLEEMEKNLQVLEKDSETEYELPVLTPAGAVTYSAPAVPDSAIPACTAAPVIPAAAAVTAAPVLPTQPVVCDAAPAETEPEEPVLEGLDDPEVARILAAAQATALEADREEHPDPPAARTVCVDPDDDEPVTPRPKFNFEDLQFGSNFGK